MPTRTNAQLPIVPGAADATIAITAMVPNTSVLGVMKHPRYDRAALLFRIASEQLASDTGDIRDRLAALDKELFNIRPEDLSDDTDVLGLYKQLRDQSTALAAKDDEGRLNATFQRSRHKTLSDIARLIVEIERRLSGSR
jgi:hypothetical protein